MAQLFTLQFSKYHFEQQLEFTLTFPNADDLPFTYQITDGMVCVDHLHPLEDIQDPEERKLHLLWRRKGLQEGIRMVRIQNTDITEEDPLSDEISERWHRRDIERLIEEQMGGVDNDIDITFREDILDVDDSSPLGLAYDAKLDSSRNDDDSDSDDEEERGKETEMKSKVTELLGI